jgi:uncharacterized protein DUF3306
MNDEQFLARWSRRKQDAKAGDPEPAAEEAAQGQAPNDRAAAEPVLRETDLSNLPPIESIDAATDIAAFLRKGIPQELSRAALRRAWSADPAIRDFVGLAENAWDFNDPNAMAGFGPLDHSAEHIEALVHRIVGGVVETANSLSNPPAEAVENAGRSPNQVKAIMDPQPLEEPTAADLPSNSAASQPEATSEETSLPRRTHGGALPR